MRSSGQSDARLLGIIEALLAGADAAALASSYGLAKRTADALVKLVSNETGGSDYLRRIVETSPNLVYVRDLVDGRFAYLNAAAQALTGHSPEYLRELGDHVTAELIHPDDVEPLKEHRARFLAPGGPEYLDIEFRVRHADGKWVILRCREAVFSRDDSGMPRTVVAVAVDVTERAAAEAALRESSERYRRLMEAVTDYVFTVRVEGGRPVETIHGVACSAVTGYAPEDFSLDPDLWLKMVHEDDRAAVIEQAKRVLLGQPTLAVEHRITRKDGTRRWVRNTSVACCGPEGKVVSYDGIIEDITDRKRAELALRESEERFRAIFANAGIGIALLTVSGEMVDCNQSLQNMLQYSRDEILSLGVTGITHFEDLANDWRLFRDLVSGSRNSYQIEKRFVRKDTQLVWGRLTLSLIQEAQGEPRYAVAMMEDITERKKAVEALRESEERFRTVADFTYDWESWLSPEGNLIYVSPSCERVTGYSRDEFVSDPNLFARIIHPDDAQKWQEHRRSALTRGSAGECDFRIVTKDGRTRNIAHRCQPVQAQDGRFLGVRSSNRDITERVAEQEELYKSEDRFRTISEVTSDFAFSLRVEPDGRLTPEWRSGAVYRASGYTLEEFDALGESMLNLVHPDDQARLAEVQARLIATGEQESVEFRMVMKGGEVRWFEANARAVLDAETGVPIRLIGAARDITDKRQAEDERRRLEEQMRCIQKIESLGVLAGGVAHDFNNLLMSILGNTELLMMDVPEDSPLKEYLREIDSSARRAAELSNQMLAYSGHGHFAVESTNLSLLVRDVGQLIESAIGRKGTVEYQLEDALPAIVADALEMRQVILNLVSNAAEALGEEGAKVRISTGVVQADRAYLSSTYVDDNLPEGQYVFLEVADNGEGMNGDTLSKIFDPFFSTKFPGRGLGLAAVLGIVRGHHGAIKVHSKPGQGSTFRVLFPAADPTLC